MLKIPRAKILLVWPPVAVLSIEDAQGPNMTNEAPQYQCWVLKITMA